MHGKLNFLFSLFYENDPVSNDMTGADNIV